MAAFQTLFHPFAAGLLPLPEAGARLLFLGAQPGFRLPEGIEASLLAVQGFRPWFLDLAREGWTVTPEANSASYDAALVLCGRHRGENEARLRDALIRLRPCGLLVVGGGKTEGVDSLRKRVSTWLPIDGHAAKHHGTVFWATRPEVLPLEVTAFDEDGPAVDGFHAAPGMFSHREIDPASKLLADHLPDGLHGAVADFGAGWGYLSARVAKHDRVEAIDLYEADWASLQAARRNLATREALPLGFFWTDLLRETVERRYDAIVMNPPFHQGRAADPSMGQNMIAAAARALKPGGRLFLVANRGLPYDETLGEHFAHVAEIVRDSRFKVIAARR